MVEDRKILNLDEGPSRPKYSKKRRWFPFIPVLTRLNPLSRNETNQGGHR